MRVNELIKRLKEIKAKEGNINVRICSYDQEGTGFIAEVDTIGTYIDKSNPFSGTLHVLIEGEEE